MTFLKRQSGNCGRNLSDLIKNISICVLKVNASQMGLERHVGE